MQHKLVLISLILLNLIAIVSALSVGSVSLSFSQVVHALVSSDSNIASAVVNELRLPRALSAFVTGALLALAGVLMQVLLRNPLADPYVLGVSGGAAFAALLCILLGLGGIWISLGSFAGALFSMFLVFGLASLQGRRSPARLLLTGVIMASGWGALISFVLAVAPESNLRGMLFWLMGDLSHAPMPTLSFLMLSLGVAIALYLASDLNVLSRGDLRASSLGVEVPRLRLVIYFIASLLTASAVSLAGSIGFVGLIIPHMVRLTLGSDHRIVIPASVLLGGGFLVVTDTLARTIIAPEQLPVGVITAILGVPVFLILLQRAYRS